jgi:hypothetical protein
VIVGGSPDTQTSRHYPALRKVRGDPGLAKLAEALEATAAHALEHGAAAAAAVAVHHLLACDECDSTAERLRALAEVLKKGTRHEPRAARHDTEEGLPPR